MSSRPQRRVYPGRALIFKRGLIRYWAKLGARRRPLGHPPRRLRYAGPARAGVSEQIPGGEGGGDFRAKSRGAEAQNPVDRDPYAFHLSFSLPPTPCNNNSNSRSTHSGVWPGTSNKMISNRKYGLRLNRQSTVFEDEHDNTTSHL